MKINDVELEFNCFEEQTAKRIVKAAKHEEAAKKETANTKKLSEQIAGTCGWMKSVFDIIFGDGTGDKVCGEKNDMLRCTNAYIELLSEQKRQECEMSQSTERLKSLLAPKAE